MFDNFADDNVHPTLDTHDDAHYSDQGVDHLNADASEASDHHTGLEDFLLVVDHATHLGLTYVLDGFHSAMDSQRMAAGTHNPILDQTMSSLDDSSGVLGFPNQDEQFWHLQQHDDTCAIASQQFILDDILGQHFSEEQLCQEAIANGWYTPGGGTPLADVGNLLEAHGVQVERQEGATIQDLVTSLEQGQHVIVAVNAEDIWYHGTPDDPLASYPGIPGQAADHAVEVIGLDTSDPNHPMVILNDPGTPDGQGESVPLNVFEAAWHASDDFMVSTI